MNKAKQHEAMTPPEIDFDVELNRLEFEWRQG
jgi:hypothetical protein